MRGTRRLSLERWRRAGEGAEAAVAAVEGVVMASGRTPATARAPSRGGSMRKAAGDVCVMYCDVL